MYSVSNSLLVFIDLAMIGQLGEFYISAIGAVNQFNMIRSTIILGVSTSIGVFIAQGWGAQNKDVVNNYLVLGLVLSFIVGIIFVGFSFLLGHEILSLYLKTPNSIEISVNYLKIVSVGFLFNSVTRVYVQLLKNTSSPKVPMLTNFCGVLLNIVLNYLLIFGNWGFPALGYIGAALATLIATVSQTILILVVVLYRKLPGFDLLKRANMFTTTQFLHFLKIGGPIILHNTFWIIGVNIYVMIFNQRGVATISVYYICKSYEGLINILFSAVAGTSGIMLGKMLGANNNQKAEELSKQILRYTVVIALSMSMLFIIGRRYLISFYNISTSSQSSFYSLMIVFSILITPKAINILLASGILRSGGDTFKAMLIDLSVVWLYGIPVAFLLARVSTMPFHMVVLIVGFEEVIKLFFNMRRYRTKKWVWQIHGHAK